MRAVQNFFDGAFHYFAVKTWPSAATFKLSPTVEQRRTTALAVVHSFFKEEVVFS